MGLVAGAKAAVLGGKNLGEIVSNLPSHVPDWMKGTAGTAKGMSDTIASAKAFAASSRQLGSAASDMGTARRLLRDNLKSSGAKNLDELAVKSPDVAEALKGGMDEISKDIDSASTGFAQNGISTIIGGAKTAGQYAVDYFNPLRSDAGGLAGWGKRVGAYAGAAVGLRYLSGGGLTRNNQGERDIAGIPFV